MTSRVLVRSKQSEGKKTFPIDKIVGAGKMSFSSLLF